jgi:putative phosphoribosyl transferase
MVRKIGAPGQPEYALGAVVDGAAPVVLMNGEALQQIRPSDAYLAEEKRRQLDAIAARRERLLGARAPLPLGGRTVVVIDDGAATGATIRVAIQALRKIGCARIAAAVPVAPKSVVATLSREADEVVCLETPEPFLAVGNHYRDFGEVGDDEVAVILAETRR